MRCEYIFLIIDNSNQNKAKGLAFVSTISGHYIFDFFDIILNEEFSLKKISSCLSSSEKALKSSAHNDLIARANFPLMPFEEAIGLLKIVK